MHIIKYFNNILNYVLIDFINAFLLGINNFLTYTNTYLCIKKLKVNENNTKIYMKIATKYKYLNFMFE